MCSWCWGFAPVLEQLETRYAAPLRSVVGGLRPGPSAAVLDDQYRGTLAHHWEQVEAASGQPFDRGFLDREGWSYDTELPAIAVVTMRTVNEMATLPFFTRLQRAFYAENTDITSPEAYPPLLAGLDIDIEHFLDLLADEDMKKLAWADFAEARRLGANGFPTLLLRDGETHYVVTRGYLGFDVLEPALTTWIRDQFGDGAETLIREGNGEA